VNVTRLPPQNLDAEQSVLGGVLIDNQVFFKVIDLITLDDFYRPANGKIFAAMCELAAKSEPMDVLTLTAKMKVMGSFEEAGGAAYLVELLERVPTAINAEYHARLVSDQAVKRRLVSACTEIANRGFEPGETTDELLDYAEKSIFSLTSSKRSGAIVPIKAIVKSAFEELEKRYEAQDTITGVPSGFHELDKLTLGFQRSDLVIVACRPSMGKTSFSLGVARFASIHAKKPIVFFSLEMSKEQIVTRLLAAEAKVDSTRIRTGKLTEQDWQKMARAAGLLSETHVYIDDTPGLNVLEIRGKARRLKAELGELGLIVIDYLQLMGSVKTAESREKAIADISRSLKALARELSVPVIALSQLNRNIEARIDKRPMMADIRESGAIEQDADIIIFIHREDVDIPQQPNAASIAEFIVGKHRNGPRGTVKVAWLGQYACFENLAQTVPSYAST
jgi:replicative DNA helicase